LLMKWIKSQEVAPIIAMRQMTNKVWLLMPYPPLGEVALAGGDITVYKLHIDLKNLYT
jgi:hypothetical protein